MPRVPEPVKRAMTVDILRGDIAALPSADRAEELLPAAEGDSLTLACTDGELKSAYRVLRVIMDYGYEHEHPVHVRLVCADEAVYKAYSFQWNMWFAERKPEHKNEA